MSKKSRRKAKYRASAAKAIQAKHPQQIAKPAKSMQAKHPQQPKPVAVKPQLPARVSHEAQASVSRYQYVMPEVKRIGILAGSIIVILIILSFVL